MSNATRWVGIDLHRRRSQIAVIDQDGELTVSKRIPTGRETIAELLGDPDGTHVALEATYGWEWLADLLKDAGFDVHLAHPLRTRAIATARVKTDAVDAKTLAHLVSELRAKGSTVLEIADEERAELPIAGLPEALLAVLPGVVRAQQLALDRGLDPDAPAGLRKITPT